MNAVLSLAGMFAGIILVGTTAVFFHDVLERRALQRRMARGAGGGGSLLFGGPTRISEGRSAARGGQVVWVRAGSNRTDTSLIDQRTEPRASPVSTTRSTAR